MVFFHSYVAVYQRVARDSKLRHCFEDDTTCNRQTGKLCALEFGTCGFSQGPAYCTDLSQRGSHLMSFDSEIAGTTYILLRSCLFILFAAVDVPRSQFHAMLVPPWPLCRLEWHLLPEHQRGRSISSSLC